MAQPGSSAPLEGEPVAASVALAVAVSGCVLALLWFSLPWDRTPDAWRAPSPLALLIAAGAIALGHVATAFRIQTMLPPAPRIALREGVLVSLWHGLAMIALPARLGELALVEALSRYALVRRGAGLAVLLVQRIYDALFACAAFAFGAYGALRGGAPFVLLAAAVLGLLALSHRLEPILGWLAARSGSLRGTAGRRLHALLRDARQGVHATSARGAPLLVLGTLLFWTTEFAALWLVFRAFGTSLELFTTLFLAAGLALVYALPLPTIGGLGLAEGGLAALLLAAGWPADAAMGLGLSARLTLLALHGLVVAVLLPALSLHRRLR
jgi:uncharacterized protein (TIRG00374 family)